MNAVATSVPGSYEWKLLILKKSSSSERRVSSRQSLIRQGQPDITRSSLINNKIEKYSTEVMQLSEQAASSMTSRRLDAI